MVNSTQSFLTRHEFFLRRLHSLTGLIPVGAFMVVHLTVNASVLESPAMFQKNVYSIHSLGSLLPLVEWAFIFLPILFHGILGLVIIAGGLPNTNQYPYASNVRYTLQRATGLIAMLFILGHVFHMHGWFHADVWMENVVKPYGGGLFKPFNATSTAGAALQSPAWVAVYVVGVLSCVFHLANGLWTMGITWGVWTTPKAQARATALCLVFGLLLAGVSMGGLFGMRAAVQGDGMQEAVEIEEQIYQSRIASGELQPNEHKRTGESGKADAE